jgi:hypothetical protein
MKARYVFAPDYDESDIAPACDYSPVYKPVSEKV